MFLKIILSEEPLIEASDEDASEFIRDRTRFAEFRRDWGDDFYLGFFDWLRTDAGDVIGVRLTLHEGREILKRLVPRRHYISWLTPHVVEVLFRRGTVDDIHSVDQEFSVSRCLVADDGTVALLFDAGELTSAQLNSLRGGHATPT